MDFLTYLRIRAYCWQDVRPHIDTPDRETLLRFRVKSEGGRRGDIRHEAIEAKWFIEATGYLNPREHAAAVLLGCVSNLYLETTTDLPRTENSPPPLGKVEADELARMTRDAVTDYGNFLPEREAAAMVAAYEKAAPEQNPAPPAPVETESGQDAVEKPKGTPAPEPKPSASSPEFFLKKSALIKKHLHEWPTIEGDLDEGGNNELSKAAKVPGKHGMWFVERARMWAMQRGKLIEDKHPSPASLATVWSGQKITR